MWQSCTSEAQEHKCKLSAILLNPALRMSCIFYVFNSPQRSRNYTVDWWMGVSSGSWYWHGVSSATEKEKLKIRGWGVNELLMSCSAHYMAHVSYWWPALTIAVPSWCPLKYQCTLPPGSFSSLFLSHDIRNYQYFQRLNNIYIQL